MFRLVFGWTLDGNRGKQISLIFPESSLRVLLDSVALCKYDHSEFKSTNSGFPSSRPQEGLSALAVFVIALAQPTFSARLHVYDELLEYYNILFVTSWDARRTYYVWGNK